MKETSDCISSGISDEEKSDYDSIDINIEKRTDEENPLFYCESKEIELEDKDQKIQFVAEEYDNELIKTTVYKDIEKVKEIIYGTEDLTNHADKNDYIACIMTGLLAGIIDIYFVREWDFADAKAQANKSINQKIMDFAKKLGFDESKCRSSDKLASAIDFLERKFHLPGDNDFHKIKDEYGKEIITANTHHLDDFCHHPTLIGLIASIVVQFSGETIYSDKNGELHNIPITVNEYGNFVGSDTPFKFFAGIINWFFTVAKTIKNQQGHLLSDMAGSSGSVAGGSGIPGFFISTLKEIAALPCLRDTSFNENLRKAFQNGIGSNKGQIDLGYFNELFKGASSKLDLRTEKAVTNELRRQAIPCIINETLVRAFYFIRRFIQQMKDVQSFSEINWKELLPIRNRTITRMLTISKGVFLTVDAVDAWLKSKNDIGTFLLRINFIGTLSFSITVVADLKMGVKKCFKENTGIGVNVKLIDLYKQQAAGLTKILKYGK